MLLSHIQLRDLLKKHMLRENIKPQDLADMLGLKTSASVHSFLRMDNAAQIGTREKYQHYLGSVGVIQGNGHISPEYSSSLRPEPEEQKLVDKLFDSNEKDRGGQKVEEFSTLTQAERAWVVTGVMNLPIEEPQKAHIIRTLFPTL